MSEGKLPNAGTAWVEETKICEYLLNVDHPVGGPKAKYFRNRGFTAEQWEVMRDALVHSGNGQSADEDREDGIWHPLCRRVLLSDA